METDGGRKQAEHLWSQACQAGEEGIKLKFLRERILNLFHSYAFDASTSKGCPEPGEGLQISKREPEVLCKGIPAIPAGMLHQGPTSTPSCKSFSMIRSSRRHVQGCDLTGIRYVVGWLL